MPTKSKYFAAAKSRTFATATLPDIAPASRAAAVAAVPFPRCQDYPSISQLGSIIKEHRINVIFAVAEDQANRYGQLSSFLDGSVSGVLERDSSNIVQLVRDNFQVPTARARACARCNGDARKSTSFHSSSFRLPSADAVCVCACSGQLHCGAL